MEDSMAPNGRYLFDVPTMRGLVAAGIAIVGFVGLAYYLYMTGGKSDKEFVVKIADFLLQGALVSLLFAILKAIIDGLKVGNASLHSSTAVKTSPTDER
jgi:hypothetical protein